MKTKNENQFIAKHFKTAWFKKTNVLFIIGLLLLLFYNTSMVAQERSSISADENRIVERKSFISNLRTKEQATRASYSNAQHIEQLLSKVQPSVYFYSGSLNTYGEKPVCLFTDIQSLNRLGGSAIQRSNIEIATIKIKSASDLNGTIDLSQFAEFKNLKYIQIVSSVPTTEQVITNMIRNNEGQYSVFFKIQSGDSEQ